MWTNEVFAWKKGKNPFSYKIKKMCLIGLVLVSSISSANAPSKINIAATCSPNVNSNEKWICGDASEYIERDGKREREGERMKKRQQHETLKIELYIGMW